MRHDVSDIAVIGMAGFFPHSPDVRTFWQNILFKKNGIDEVPPQRWDWRRYYHPDFKVQDKVNSKWGAFLPDILFDPLKFGMPPKSLSSIEISQLLILESTRQALADSGYLDRSFDKERTSVYIGTGAGQGDLGQRYSFRAQLQHYFGESSEAILKGLDSDVPEWTEDTFTGVIMNITAGRIASRFDLGGSNCTIDAACASALSALRIGMLELKAGESDMVIVGGADTLMSPYAFTCFSGIGALSPRGKSTPFDKNADGIVLGEAVATLIIKRLADAKKDGDKIYAIIKGVGSSSDGKTKGLTAPRVEGQVLALERAYKNAGVDPGSVGLIEAHGTSTIAGDMSEAKSLNEFFTRHGQGEKTCAVGSVKSMIGHAKTAAGIAGLFKAIMALRHKVLPPTTGVTDPLPELNEPNHALYVNTQARPWIGDAKHPRRAGVSAFGFGGTNFHAVLEEYPSDETSETATAAMTEWETELFVITGESRANVIQRAESLQTALNNGADAPLKDLAFNLAAKNATASPARLTIVASTHEDLLKKLGTALSLLSKKDTKEIWTPSGIYYGEARLTDDKKIAFIFPGQGSQYPGMLKDLAIQFPKIRETIERFDDNLCDRLSKPLSAFIYPPEAFSAEAKKVDEAALTQTNVAQAAMGAMDSAMFGILKDMDIKPHMTAGHSYGEYAALFAAGVMDESALSKISEARGRFILDAAHPEPGTMAAVKAPEKDVAEVLSGLESVWIANINASSQTVISGTKAGIAKAMEKLKDKGMAALSIPVACAFHSPIISGAKDKLKEFFTQFDFHSPELPVFSNTSADGFPETVSEIQDILGEQLIRPVRFVEEIQAMYDAGARIFVEVGAGTVLTNLVGGILDQREYKAICTNKKGVNDLTQLLHALAQLTAIGAAPKLDILYVGRECLSLDINRLGPGSHLPPKSRTAYYIGSGGVRPAAQDVWKPNTARDICFKDEVTKENVLSPVNQTKDTAQLYGETAENQGGETAKQMTYHIKKPAHSLQITKDNQTPETVLQNTDDVDVVSKFQDLMSQYLDTQGAVMQAYLNDNEIN